MSRLRPCIVESPSRPVRDCMPNSNPLEIEVIEADLDQRKDCDAVLDLVDQYARDPMGNGKPLPNHVQTSLIEGLKAHPTTIVWLARRSGVPIGLAICFVGFSTFSAKPLINLHDLFICEEMRGHGVGPMLLDAIATKTQAIGGCKVTLEVQSKNHRARKVYEEEAGGVLILARPV